MNQQFKERYLRSIELQVIHSFEQFCSWFNVRANARTKRERYAADLMMRVYRRDARKFVRKYRRVQKQRA